MILAKKVKSKTLKIRLMIKNSHFLLIISKYLIKAIKDIHVFNIFSYLYPVKLVLLINHLK